MEKKLEDTRSIDAKMLLQIDNGPIAVVPERLSGGRSIRQPFIANELGMYAVDQHLLVIRAIKDADPAAFGQTAYRAPKKVVFQFFGIWLLETEHLAALGIDPGHHMPNDAVLPGTIHALKNQKQRMTVGGVEQLLQ